MVAATKRYRWFLEFSLVKIIGAALLLVSCGGGGGDSSPVIPPTTSPAAPLTPAVSGEIRFAPGALATVFWDENGNWEADPWEKNTTASGSGKYEISPRPRPEAVLKARTRWLAPNVYGEHLGPITLSAINGQETVISPFTSLAHIAGMSITQIEAELRLSQFSDAVENAQLSDLANAVAVQLQNREVQLQKGDSAIAALAILEHTKSMTSNGSAFSTKSAGTLKPQSGTSITAKGPFSTSASSFSRLNADTYSVDRVSGFDSYLWLTSDASKRLVVQRILNEMLTSSRINVRDLNTIRFDLLNNFSEIDGWIRQLSSAGITRNALEAQYDFEINREATEFTERATKDMQILIRDAAWGEASTILSNSELYVNMAQTAFGLTGALSGLPVNKAVSVGVVKFDKSRAIFLDWARVLNCGNGLFSAIDAMVEKKSEDTAKVASLLADCMLTGTAAGSRVDPKGVLIKAAKFIDAGGESLAPIFNGAIESDPLRRRILGFKFLSGSLSMLSTITPDARVSGVFDVIAAVLGTVATSMEIVADSQEKYDDKVAALNRLWKAGYDAIRLKQYRMKLTYRLSQVISYTPRSVINGITIACTPKPQRKINCALSSLQAFSLKSQSAVDKLQRSQLSNSSEPESSFHVSFGDGWTTDNLPEFVGKVILPGATLDHAYLTTGRYTVIATTRLAGGEFLRDEVIVNIANDTQIVNGVCGSANGVSVTQRPSTNLCSAGSAGSVSGSGPWTWTCSGTGGGSTASCSAPLAAASSCIGTWDGQVYQVGAVEERFPNTCPVGTTGQVRNFHTCQAGGSWSPVATSDNCTATLLPPSNANVASVNTGLQVTWNTVAGATGYNIYRGGSLRTNVSGGLTSSSIDTNVARGTNYCYEVEAVSTFSNPISVSTRTAAGCATYSSGPPPLLPPANVSASQISGGGLRVSWSASSGADGYVLTRQNDNQSWNLSASTLNYNDLTVTPGISYAYVVQAKRGNERSSQSTQANAIAPSVPVSGNCGAANGVTVSQQPTADLCNAGSASGVTGSGPWSWSCTGSNGGSTASCSAPYSPPVVPVNGVCGAANGVAVLSRPITNLCSAGSASVATGVGPWNWTCTGANGGSTVSCAAPLAAQPVPPSVSGFSPKFGSRGTAVIVTVAGTGLPDTLALAIANVSCNNRALLSSTTTQQFDCTIPSTASLGMALVTVKDRSGGKILFQPSLTQGFEIR